MADKRIVALVGFLAVASALGAEEPRETTVSFASEAFETPQLARLRRLYNYDEKIAKGASEMEQMLLLKSWVFRNIPYQHNYDLSYMHDSLDILSLATAGTGFLCTQLSAVYTQLAVSMGWTSRYIFNRNPNGDEHSTNEIWSNQLGKWVFIDVTWNLHMEKSGVPLSAMEIRREWLANKGRSLVYVYGAGADEARYTASQFPVKRNDNRAWREWPLDEAYLGYLWEMAYVGRNDFFSNDVMFWDNIQIYRDEANGNDDSWGFRHQPAADVETLYHDVNRVDIQLASRDARLVTVKLDAGGPRNTTPNFKEFLVRVNGGDWKALTGDSLTVGANGPNTTLQARVRNKFGVLGPVTTRVLRPYAQPLTTVRP
jgi:hypothetical protein